jgi:hypothetical protein
VSMKQQLGSCLGLQHALRCQRTIRPVETHAMLATMHGLRVVREDGSSKQVRMPTMEFNEYVHRQNRTRNLHHGTGIKLKFIFGSQQRNKLPPSLTIVSDDDGEVSVRRNVNICLFIFRDSLLEEVGLATPHHSIHEVEVVCRGVDFVVPRRDPQPICCDSMF